MQKLQNHLFPSGANKENKQNPQQEKKLFMDYGEIKTDKKDDKSNNKV